MSKPKRKSKLITYELLPGEEVLWQGRPLLWRLFTTYDLWLIPVSLVWCSFTVPFLITSLRSGDLFFIIFPHAWVGLYMLFGRFVYKLVRKQHTHYVITDRRVLIINNLLGKRVKTYNLDHLPNLSKTVGFGGVGSITFADMPNKSWWNRGQVNYSNTGLDFFGGTVPGFYDIPDVEEVYQLIVELTYDTAWNGVEKNKPAFLPR
jgi:hypothetical protein